MKTQVKILTLLLLCCLATLEGKAQLNINTQRAFDEFIANKYVTVKRSHNMERDFTMPGNPIKAKSETYTFSLPYKKRDLLQTILQAFNEDSNNPLCYNMATHTGGRGVPVKLHDLLIGNSEQNFIRLGENELANWTLICMLDPQDTTRTHRYAYAIEYDDSRNKNRDITGRLIITYARIPQHVLDSNNGVHNYNATITSLPVSSDALDLHFGISSTLEWFSAYEALKSDFINGDNRLGVALGLYALCREGTQRLTFTDVERDVISIQLDNLAGVVKDATAEAVYIRSYLRMAASLFKK